MGADAREANLSGANLAKAILIGADLRKANVTRARLDEAILVSAMLSEARLEKASLRWANLGVQTSALPTYGTRILPEPISVMRTCNKRYWQGRA